MGEELRIDSEKAKLLAEELAARTGETVAQAVEHALEQKLASLGPPKKPSQDEIDVAWKEVEARAKALRASLPPGVTSDHSDMYDEYGLPI